MTRLAVLGLDVTLGGARVLRGIDLELRPGGLVGVTGPNGAGKSTLLRALCRLVSPCSGRIEIDGVPLARLARREIAGRIAYLPQALEDTPAFTVEHIVRMGRYPQLGRFQAPGPEDAGAVQDAIARTDVAHLRRRQYPTLSGGERQRVRLARILATRAPALLLDEPAAGLDVRHALELLRMLRKIAAEGRVVVATLHDLDLAFRYCDRIVVMEAGCKAADGSPDVLIEPGLVRRIFGVEATPLRDGGRRALFLELREPPGSCAGDEAATFRFQ